MKEKGRGEGEGRGYGVVGEFLSRVVCCYYFSSPLLNNTRLHLSPFLSTTQQALMRGGRGKDGINEGEKLLLEYLDHPASQLALVLRPNGKYKRGDIIEVPGDHHDKNDILYT